MSAVEITHVLTTGPTSAYQREWVFMPDTFIEMDGRTFTIKRWIDDTTVEVEAWWSEA